MEPLFTACDWPSRFVLAQASSSWNGAINRFRFRCQELEATGMRFDRGPVIMVCCVSRVCPELRKIRVSSPEFGDRHLERVLLRCPKLRHVDLRGCVNLTGEALFHVGLLCPRLNYLNLYRTLMGNVDLQTLAVFVRRDDGTEGPAPRCEAHAGGGRGEMGHDVRMGVEEEGERVVVPPLPLRMDSHGVPARLQRLSLGNNPVGTSAVLAVVARTPTLVALDISWTQVNGGGVASIARVLPHLRVLELDGLDGTTDDTTSEVMRSCPNLEHLSMVAGQEKVMSQSHISDRTVDALIAAQRPTQSLRHVNLASHNRITDGAVCRLLDQCPRLISVGLLGLHHLSKETVQRAAALGRVATNTKSGPSTSGCYSW
jgi:hypothetical protein